MDWTDIKGVVATSAPLLGTLLGGPAGGAVGALIASALGVGDTPGEVASAIAVDPTIAVKLRQIEKERQIELQTLLVQAESHRLTQETAALVSVNQTMQVEAQSNHWPSYTWRPFIGFVFGVTFFGVYFVLPLCKMPVPAIPTEAWLSIGAILGVASWFRGKAQADPTNPMPAGKG
jgi:hypothetical protein